MLNTAGKVRYCKMVQVKQEMKLRTRRRLPEPGGLEVPQRGPPLALLLVVGRQRRRHARQVVRRRLVVRGEQREELLAAARVALRENVEERKRSFATNR